MILGAFVLKMRSTGNASLPVSHGRLLHAALLDLVRKYDESLAQELHNSSNKCFSIGLLNFGTLKPEGVNFPINVGTLAKWRVCSLDERLTNLLMRITGKIILRIGRAAFEVEGNGFGDNIKPHLINMGDIIEKSSFMTEIEHFTIRFITPTTFRCYEYDYPFPRADLIFGSLIEKWNNASDSFVFDAEKLKMIASQHFVPIKWQGETRRVSLSPRNGVTGFVGSFTFDIKSLPEDYRRIFFILLEFARFSGIGRLTGQGLGSIKVEYE